MPRAVTRTCVICRKGAEKGDLFRFVAARAEVGGGKEGRPGLFLDVLGREDGRGAYSHQGRECLFNKTLGDKLLFSLQGRQKRKARRQENIQLEQILTQSLELLESGKHRRQEVKQFLERMKEELAVGKEIKLRETRQQGKKSRLIRL